MAKEATKENLKNVTPVAEPAKAVYETPTLSVVAGDSPKTLSKLEALMVSTPKISMTDLVDAKALPVGAVVSGIILEVRKSFNPKVSEPLLLLEHTNEETKEKTQFLFPVTGTVREALAPGMKRADTDAAKAALKAQLESHIGNLFIARKKDGKLNKEHNKDMHMFDIWSVKQ